MEDFLDIEPGTIATKDLHAYMLHSVAPRPIAFVSTLDDEGVPNLAPYSFFNAFSSHPPTLIFSSNRRVKDNTTKHTLANAQREKEVVINVVSYSIVRQMALTSIEYPIGVNEFNKAGLGVLSSKKVKPPRVAESPVQFECSVEQIIPLGEEGGAGNLIICRILLMHINRYVLNQEGKIDPHKIDLCGRMGGELYVRASGDAIFELNQPVNKIGIGFDALPPSLLNSPILTGNHLSKLAALTSIPTEQDVSMDYRHRQLNSKEEFHNHLLGLIENEEFSLTLLKAIDWENYQIS